MANEGGIYLHDLNMAVLAHYPLRVLRIDDYGKVKKVHTAEGTFALKKISDVQQLHAIEQAAFFYRPQMIPIYWSKRGTLFVAEGGYYYYVMPWISLPSGQRATEAMISFFRDLATLHQKTLQEINVDETELKNYYETKKAAWEEERSFLQSYAEQCEHEWYMSPFQLQFCTYFHETMQAYWFAETQLETWYEKMKETKKWRVAFVHGNARFSHYVPREQGGQFFSWERAKWAFPLVDVAAALDEYVRTPSVDDTWVDGFREYEKKLSLREEELAFFSSHVASPTYLYRVVSDYAEKRKKEQTEYRAVSELQRAYWIMKRTEQLLMRMTTLNPLEVESDSQSNENG
ncbi:spore coat protein YsxE [Anoxybacillus sp. J5B_2022]|uniref:spore coat protein YsxE n=1 Tax=Anoxybacillus sp. J5B_2022 TaxID=3003246 RepID=UPI0022864851|nr:spore coat protein YsxE [Anoxybacillus sp. J5B_2022]MCZ0754775.1 spore coat protein YsxE [Anoxybacillus sp. J5B_2022]